MLCVIKVRSQRLDHTTPCVHWCTRSNEDLPCRVFCDQGLWRQWSQNTYTSLSGNDMFLIMQLIVGVSAIKWWKALPLKTCLYLIPLPWLGAIVPCCLFFAKQELYLSTGKHIPCKHLTNEKCGTENLSLGPKLGMIQQLRWKMFQAMLGFGWNTKM